MTTLLFQLHDHRLRMEAMRVVQAAPDDYVCEIKPRARSLGQNDKLHAMFSDIARQVDFSDQKRDPEVVKCLLLDLFARVKSAEGELLPGYGTDLPSLIGNEFVHLGI